MLLCTGTFEWWLSQCRPAAADGKFFPVSRELVFDIDLTDYDDVRTCGSGGHICNSCWPLMAVAIQVVPSPLHPGVFLL